MAILSVFALLLLALGSTVRASSNNEEIGTTSLDFYNAKFDNLPKNPASVLFPVGNYQGLKWNSFITSSFFTTGLKPPSKPNGAAFTSYTAILFGPPYITPLNAGSTLQLHSFYYGCVLSSAESVVAVPTPCNLTVTGYKGAQLVGSQTFEFTPDNTLTATMDVATLGHWARGLSNVTFDVGDNPVVAGKVDNVRYAVSKQKDSAPSEDHERRDVMPRGASTAVAQSYNAKFDDFPKLPVSVTNPVGSYKGLQWNAFSAASFYTTGLVPHSLPNNAAYGIRGEVTNGQPSIAPLASRSTFDLTSFFYGCVLNTMENAVNVPIACSITIVGFRGGKVAGNETFEYNPKGGLTSPMYFTTVGPWARGLNKVTFATENDTLIATRFDDVRYTIYTGR